MIKNVYLTKVVWIPYSLLSYTCKKNPDKITCLKQWSRKSKMISRSWQMLNDLCSMNVINFTRTDTENKSQILQLHFLSFISLLSFRIFRGKAKTNIYSQCLYLKVVEDFVCSFSIWCTFSIDVHWSQLHVAKFIHSFIVFCSIFCALSACYK